MRMFFFLALVLVVAVAHAITPASPSSFREVGACESAAAKARRQDGVGLDTNEYQCRLGPDGEWRFARQPAG